ncbi:beta-lactamase hydrolase domain-containing protein [Dokdonella sp.]|uniref:beta-lactamase hydrolase domain-containing protein n=1 Tax=Dokdonella sp. TaxID=2291710 RepID=UPI0031C2144C|nr:sulfur transferase domain-containing protein [Dokdonella sp.]
MRWTLTLVLVALASLLAGCTAQVTRPDGFSEPRPGLITGGQPDATTLRQFAHDGGWRIIDLRTPDEARGYDERALADELGVDYINLPIEGAEGINASNAAALYAALVNARGPILLHCASGNRVGALLALEAAQVRGLDPQAALELGRRAGLRSLEPVVRERLGLGVAAQE